MFSYKWKMAPQTPPSDNKSLLVERTPVRFLAEFANELRNLPKATSPEEKQTAVGESKYVLLKMAAAILEAIIDDGKYCFVEGAVPQGLLPFFDYPMDGLDGMFFEGSTLIPPMLIGGIGIYIDMNSIPLFMEWEFSKGKTCRVLVNPETETFYVLHIHYSDTEVYGSYPCGRGFVDGMFSFSLSDIESAGRMKTITAAFTPVARDDDGNVTDDWTQIHDSFQLGAICH